MTDNFRAIAGIAAIAITVLAAPLAANTVKHANMARAEAAQKTATIQQPAVQVKSEPAPQVAAPIEPPKPALWAVTTSPHGRVSVEQINTVLQHLQARGVTKLGAAYLTGNFIAESYLQPHNCEGDGGTACGLGQWRFSRQEGMPAELIAQLDWAIDVEMPRDNARGGGHSLHTVIFDTNATADDLIYALKKYERYGVEGGRYQYAAAIYAQL